jgi:hypothetical protein
MIGVSAKAGKDKKAKNITKQNIREESDKNLDLEKFLTDKDKQGSVREKRDIFSSLFLKIYN